MKKLLFFLLSFSFASLDAQYVKLHDFNGADGQWPKGDLFSDGTFLYGMTSQGGTNNMGTIFKLKPDGTGFQNLYDFAGADGSYPYGSLIYDGMFLYGMTSTGGANNKGTVFKIKPDGSGYVLLLSFSGPDGNEPHGSLLSDGTFLYGMTWRGGANDLGIIFKIKPDGSAYSDLLDFAGPNGSNPSGSLISDGTYLYGMTMQQGLNSQGTIFKIKTDGSAFATLFGFAGNNGSNPYGSLVYDGNFLYGMTNAGDIAGKGVLFKIKPDGSNYTDMGAFIGGPFGSHPYGSLILDGKFLYGMNNDGGPSLNGVLFRKDTTGNSAGVLVGFMGTSNGGNPYGSLIKQNGILYGMTATGGASNNGTVFKLCIPISVSQSFTLCAGQGVSVGSHTYTSSGTFTDTLPAINSCDSIVVTNLTVLPQNTFSQWITKCAGESITVGSHTYTTSGTYTDIIPSVVTGCDSTITTHLAVLSSSSSASSQTLAICSGQAAQVGTDSYTTSGTYTYTFQGGSCDSTVTTTLIVNPTPTISVSGDNAICSGNATTLTATGNGTYEWSTSDTSASIVASPSATTVYSATVTNGPCAATAFYTVNVYQPPVASFSSAIYGCCGNNWLFTDTTHATSGDPIVGWNWSFSGGSPNSSASSSQQTYLPFGVHAVCLTVVSSSGCSDSSCQNILVTTMNIGEGENSSSLLIYPNPICNTIYLKSKNIKEGSEIRISDLLGNEVKSQKPGADNQHTVMLDVSDLEEGAYFITLYSSGGSVTRKIIIQR